MAQSPDVICERRGAVGLVVLNRPQALNAITLGMLRDMRRALDEWAHDDAVTRVLITAAGDRAFCAGGDIRHLYEFGQARRYEEALVFWREEYALNILIKRYPKPYLALIDGIVMGGGVGVSLHGSHRIAGEGYAFAMPEVGIGFFPDVGATYALPRLGGNVGMYLALTGERVRAADALALGLATHAVSSGGLGRLRDSLIEGEPVDNTLAAAATNPAEGPLQKERELIDSCFSGSNVIDVLERLDLRARAGCDFAAKTAATIRAKSPTSLRIAFEQMRRGGALTFEEAMKTEFRIVARLIEGHDFYEGVRATIIDKEAAPRWNPPTLEEVSDAEIGRHFDELGELELKVA
jgi:enoyl-CoA hydratase